MKCIENHPIRNSLLAAAGGGGVASTKLLQQIDMLKRELILRDQIAGCEPWTHELSRGQKARTLQLAAKLAMEAPVIEVDGDDACFAEPVAVQSLAQVTLLAAALRSMIWESSQGDAGKVGVSVRKVLSKLSGGSTLPIATTEEDVAVNAAVTSDELAQATSAISPVVSSNEAVIYPSSIDENSSIQASKVALASVDLSVETEQVTEGPGITFEEFVAGPGQRLHSSYLEIKEALRNSKARQKQIINIVNDRKAKIDEVSDELQRQEGSSEELSGLLDNYKREYRGARTELTLCKDQISETESLKKRAMAALMKAFEEYATQS
jgi:hypothetical protein